MPCCNLLLICRRTEPCPGQNYENQSSCSAARTGRRPSLTAAGQSASRIDQPGIREEIGLVSRLPIMISHIIPGMLNSYKSEILVSFYQSVRMSTRLLWILEGICSCFVLSLSFLVLSLCEKNGFRLRMLIFRVIILQSTYKLLPGFHVFPDLYCRICFLLRRRLCRLFFQTGGMSASGRSYHVEYGGWKYAHMSDELELN